MDKEIKKMMTEEQIYELALKRLRMKKELFKQIVTYFVVNAFLVLIDVMYSDGTWFYYVLGIWGIALLGKIVRVYTSLKYIHSTKAINKEIEKLK